MLSLCCSYIIGEHGDSSVPIWSSVNIAGTRLRDLCPTAGESPDKDPENWDQVHKDVINAANEIISLKGYTSWGIGIMCAKLSEAILRNQVDRLSVMMLSL
jgi:L-lactate dehydrogenase